MAVHRMNICIEVPAIEGQGEGFEHASLVSFNDMLEVVQAIVVQKHHHGRGTIARASYEFSTEWSVESELETKHETG